MSDIELTSEHKKALRISWQDRSLTELADFIESHYHARATKMVAEIITQIDSIGRSAAKEVRDVLIPLKHLRQMLTEDLVKHTREEEEILFPYIRNLEKGGGTGDVLHSISRIHHEHDQIMDTLVRLKLESTLYRLPESPCDICQALCDSLLVFLSDLQEHTFLEDEVLFVEALELEKHHD